VSSQSHLASFAVDAEVAVVLAAVALVVVANAYLVHRLGLDAERRDATGRVLAAPEAERLRIAGTGMRERAALIGASLKVRTPLGGGPGGEVRLDVPLEAWR
jgi:hypothetical protein